MDEQATTATDNRRAICWIELSASAAVELLRGVLLNHNPKVTITIPADALESAFKELVDSLERKEVTTSLEQTE